MDNSEKETLAIVPYEPVKPKTGKYVKMLDKGFTAKRKAYIGFFFLGLFMFFMAYCLEKRFNGIDFDSEPVFFSLRTDGTKVFYATQGIRFLLISTLAMFISSFTVFSPAVAVSYFAFFSFCAGLYCTSVNGVFQTAALTVFIIATLAYSVEVMSAYSKAKYGIKQILKPANVIAVSTATFSYTAFILLYAYYLNI